MGRAATKRPVAGKGKTSSTQLSDAAGSSYLQPRLPPCRPAPATQAPCRPPAPSTHRGEPAFASTQKQPHCSPPPSTQDPGPSTHLCFRDEPAVASTQQLRQPGARSRRLLRLCGEHRGGVTPQNLLSIKVLLFPVGRASWGGQKEERGGACVWGLSGLPRVHLPQHVAARVSAVEGPGRHGAGRDSGGAGGPT